MKLVSHFSSVSTKVIVRGNMMKPTKCYNFHKQETHQQEKMETCIFMIFAINRYKSQHGLKRHQKNCTLPAREEIVDTTSYVEDTFVDNSQQQITSRFE